MKGGDVFWIDAIRLAVCVGGIYGAYITQGFYQEALSTTAFGPDKAHFPHLGTLNGFQSWVCFIWAFFLIQLGPFVGRPRNKSKNSTMPPWTAYWKAGLTNCFGPAMGFAALKYISYPAQVLVKSSKMIPVMLMGTLLHGIRYPPSEYFCCSLVIAGVSMFALKSSSHGASRLVSPNAPLGYGMCLANLVLDGYTNAKQDEINRRYKGGSNPIDMMCWMNFWTGVFYVPVMFIFTSTGKEVIEFCAAYPEAIVQLLLLCLCGAIGQLFIYYTIRQFGSLILTLVTTTRKFFSILFSVLLAGNTLLFEQWIAVFFVFTGLLLSTITKHRRRIKPRQHED